jgi:hypothetical protein
MKLFSAFISATLAARECGDYACVEAMETVGCLDTCYEDDCHGTQMYCCGELAQNDWDAIIKFQSVTKAAAEEKRIDHNILAAVMSRESRAGRKLESWNGEFGWGKCKNGSCYGWGLMQVDRRFHQPVGTVKRNQKLSSYYETWVIIIFHLKFVPILFFQDKNLNTFQARGIPKNIWSKQLKSSSTKSTAFPANLSAGLFR